MRGGGRRGQEARGGRPPARPGSPSLRPPRFPRRVRAFPAALHVFMAREIQTLRTHLARKACRSTSSPPCPPMPSRQEDAYAEDEAHRPPRARARPSPSSSRLRARSSLFKRRRRLLHFATFDFNSQLKVGAGGGEEWAHLAACPLPPAERPQPVGRTLSSRSERPDNYLQVLFLPDWRS